jgi:hypothetical protein
MEKFIKIDAESLKKVLIFHRINEIFETVETFDDVLIRNKYYFNFIKFLPSIDTIYNREMRIIIKSMNEYLCKYLNIKCNLDNIIDYKIHEKILLNLQNQF